VTGVAIPEAAAFLRGRRSASEAARKSKFVVPRALVDPDRAEQTMATLCWSMYSLDQNKRGLSCDLCIRRCVQADYERNDVLRYFDSKLSNARASKFLYKPFGRWIYCILVHVWRRTRWWCPRRRGGARGVRHGTARREEKREIYRAGYTFQLSGKIGYFYTARRHYQPRFMVIETCLKFSLQRNDSSVAPSIHR
jgi:hypothetical protein